MTMIKFALLVLIVGTHNSLGTLPLFANQPSNIFIFETDENGNKQDLIIPCAIEMPSPTVKYTWFRGGEELPRYMVNGSGSLLVSNITEGEYATREGVKYHCIASDNIGFTVAVRSRTITVYYVYFDGFREIPALDLSTIEVPVSVALNSDVALECDVLDANPPPQIQWYDDLGEILEIRSSNKIRFLDNGRYLYLKGLQATHLDRRYHCAVTNVNLTQEISAPTRYNLVDNLTRGVLADYKQIGDLKAFVGNTNVEFAYVGGVFGENLNGTANRLYKNDTLVSLLGNIGTIDHLASPGVFTLKADVRYDGMSTTRNGSLTVIQVPKINNKLSIQDETVHYIGEHNLRYTCEFEGFPSPIATFYFNGHRITSTSVDGVIIVNNTLTIPFPQVFHSGIYQCIVSNEFGDDQAAWLLEMRQALLPTVQPYNFTELDAFDDRDLGALFTRDNGSFLSFSVDVVADPCPSIEWTFNGSRLRANEIISFDNPCIGEDRRLTRTFLLNVSITEATVGSYSATLSNIAGTTMLPKVYLATPEPNSIIALTVNDTCLKNDSSATLRCNVKGFPRPTIQFQLNDSMISPGVNNFENFVLEFYDQMTILDITDRLGGIYTCITTGASGVTMQRSKAFEFCAEPAITGVNFTPNPYLRESFFIECTYTAIPRPDVFWSKEETVLRERDIDNVKIISSMGSSRLEINDATTDFSGMYRCNISNAAGFSYRTIDIQLQEAPRSSGDIAVIAVFTVTIISISIFGIILIIMYCVCKIRAKRGL